MLKSSHGKTYLARPVCLLLCTNKWAQIQPKTVRRWIKRSHWHLFTSREWICVCVNDLCALRSFLHGDGKEERELHEVANERGPPVYPVKIGWAGHSTISEKWHWVAPLSAKHWFKWMYVGFHVSSVCAYLCVRFVNKHDCGKEEAKKNCAD